MLSVTTARRLTSILQPGTPITSLSPSCWRTRREALTPSRSWMIETTSRSPRLPFSRLSLVTVDVLLQQIHDIGMADIGSRIQGEVFAGSRIGSTFKQHLH